MEERMPAETPVQPNKRLRKEKKSRIWELDFLRGICVLLMVWDHLMYDVVAIYGPEWIKTGKQFLIDFYAFAQNYEIGALREFFHPVIYTLFFVLCGISCSFSRNNLKRGIQALALAFGITLVTTLMDTPIRFGVLHMLGFAILIWWVLHTLCGNRKGLTAAVSFGVGVAIVLTNAYLTAHPPAPNDAWAFVGEFFRSDSYRSADYFPLLPNVGYMLIGAAAGPILYGKKKSLLPWLDRFHWYAPVNFWGRIALWVYVTHQILVVVLLSALSYLFFTPGDLIFF